MPDDHRHTLKLPLLTPSPVYCAQCVHRLREAVGALAGVGNVEVDPGAGTLTVVHDPALMGDEALEAEITRLGLQVSGVVGHAAFKVIGLDCPDCARSIDKSVSYVDGVLSADLNFATGVLVVEYDPASDPRTEIVERLRWLGYGAEPLRDGLGPTAAEFRIAGLDCPDCASKLATRIGAMAGVESAALDFGVARVRVSYDPRQLDADEIGRAIREAGYTAEPVEVERGGAPSASWWEIHRHELTTAACGGLLVLGWLLALVAGLEVASIAAYAAAIVVGGLITAQRAVASVRTRSLDMNVLMTVAVIGAAAIGEWSEGATVVFLFSLGGLLEARSLARTRRSIRDLMRLAPETARVVRDGAEVEAPPAEVGLGETIVVKPGERIPLDGEVRRGASAVDESPITGESVPAEKATGDAVYAGTLNTSGLLEVRVTSTAGDSTLARVIYLVEEAQGQRAPLQRIVDRFTRWYTPVVVGLAVAVALVPPLVGLVTGIPTGGFDTWFYRALVLLVISCPCALVISTPVAIVSAITRATRDGVLVKGGAFLEIAPQVRALAFDKTGTLTRGRPEVAEVVPLNGMTPDEALRIAGALESGSTHPLAGAVTRAAGTFAGRTQLGELAEQPGRGVSALIGGHPYAIGSIPYARELGVISGDGAEAAAAELEERGETVLVLSSGDEALALIGVADEMRPESPEIVAKLRQAGVLHLVMLTGDNERTAKAVAERAGVDEVRSRLLPEDKVAAVRELRERFEVVAMVGDGVNDAPAMAASDIGIAMGAAGSDTALETADVALMADDLRALPGFFGLGRRAVSNVRQNVAFSIAVKAAVLLLAITGRATLWMAVFADTGVALLVILNGLRLLRPARQRSLGGASRT